MNLRRAVRSALLALALLPLLGPPPAGAEARPAPACRDGIPAWAPAPTSSEVRALGEHLVAMSDGTTIALDVTLPAGLEGPFPTVVSITGYGKSAAIGGGGLTAHGYAVVSIDDRGTGASGGQWDAWGSRTRADYPELIDWVIGQPWSDGTVALDGASYGGITSLFAAASGHPAVRAVFATIPMSDAYRDITFAGGQVNAAFIPLWMGLVTGLGVVNATGRPDALVDHLLGAPGFQVSTVLQALTGGEAAYDGPFWRQRSPLEVADRIDAPTFIVGGLDDIFQRGEPLLYEALADHTDARLLLGPWAHLTAGQGLPADGVPSVDALRLQWFDEHLKGVDTGVECVPPVVQYVRGVDEYRTASTWPVPGLTAQRWYLLGDGGLSTAEPPEDGPGRTYAQLPTTGLCTRSANQWLIGVLTGSPCETDNRLDESLPGSLTYTSEAVAEPTYVNGPIQADLWLVPSTEEALVSVSVSDVAPDGTSRGLTNGLLSASHRAVDPARARVLDGQSIQPWHPFGRADVLPVTPGEAIHVPVEVFPTSAVLEPGHRLRVTIAAYDVPHALPPLPALVDSLGGPVTVLHDAAHPSSVVLPVVDARPSGPPAAGRAPSLPALHGEASQDVVDVVDDARGMAAVPPPSGTRVAGVDLTAAAATRPAGRGAPAVAAALVLLAGMLAGIAPRLRQRRPR